MFPFPYNLRPTPAERNAERDERIADSTRQAIGALESMLSELRTLQTAMQDDDWRSTARTPGGGYHLAEYVGRQYSAAGHGLRRFYEASVLATTTAGGYEPEPSEPETVYPTGAEFATWQDEVLNGDTRLGLIEWATNRRTNNQED